MALSITPLVGEKFDRLEMLLENNYGTGSLRFGTSGCVLKEQYADSAQVVKEFFVREDDVWVITPPKCGTTWTQEMVWLLMNNFDYKGAKEKKMFLSFPYLEFSRLMTETNRQQLIGGLDTLDCAASYPPPRCIRSHLPKDLLPDQLWSKKPKIIYVAREPKDVAVSFYYHSQIILGYKGDKEFLFECFYDDLVQYTPFWEHVLEFWKIKDEPNIMFNTYEEIKQNLPAVIRRTAKFLDKSVTDVQVEQMTEHLDIKQMKKNPAVNLEGVLSKMRERGSIKDDQAFIRKGVVGEGNREMSPQTAARFDERTRRVFNEAVGGCPWNI